MGGKKLGDKLLSCLEYLNDELSSSLTAASILERRGSIDSKTIKSMMENFNAKGEKVLNRNKMKTKHGTTYRTRAVSFNTKHPSHISAPKTDTIPPSHREQNLRFRLFLSRYRLISNKIYCGRTHPGPPPAVGRNF